MSTENKDITVFEKILCVIAFIGLCLCVFEVFVIIWREEIPVTHIKIFFTGAVMFVLSALTLRAVSESKKK